MTASQPSALELAERVAAVIPRATFLTWMNTSGVPYLRYDFEERCPACGRRLPCSVGPLGGAGSGAAMILRSRRELRAECLVDGPRAQHAQSFGATELIEAAAMIADALQRQRWRRWARFIHAATEALPNSKVPPIERAGQSLEALRVYGPFESIPEPERVEPLLTAARRALEVLVASTGPYWTT